jgi:hypothetical protein
MVPVKQILEQLPGRMAGLDYFYPEREQCFQINVDFGGFRAYCGHPEPPFRLCVSHVSETIEPWFQYWGHLYFIRIDPFVLR